MSDFKLLKNEEEWLAYIESRQKDINDDPQNEPDSYPCLMIWEHYGKNSSGWWRWTFAFLYPSDCEELMEAARLREE